MSRDELLELYANKWLQRSRHDCGCHPICRCNSQVDLEIFKERSLEEAEEMHSLYLGLLKAEKQATPYTRDMPVAKFIDPITREEQPDLSQTGYLIPKTEKRDSGFRIGQEVVYRGDKRTIYDVDEGYGILALDGDKYISPNDPHNRCIEARMSECVPVAEKPDSGFDEWQHEYEPYDASCKQCDDTGYTGEHDRCHPPNYYICTDCDAYSKNKPTTKSLDPKGEAGSTKTPLWLVPPAASAAAALVHAHGAKKYGAFNWRATRVCASTYISALQRHFDSWRDGEDNDPESGLSHLAHVAANVNILLDAAACGVLEDDRFKRPAL